MLLGGATVPPTETLVVEDELLLPEEEPPLLVGAGLFGAGANPRIPDEVLEGERKAR